jgi:hypothetical protein
VAARALAAESGLVAVAEVAAAAERSVQEVVPAVVAQGAEPASSTQ